MKNKNNGKSFMEVNDMNENKSNIRVVSLSGDGGIFSKGFYDEGFELEFALEPTEARAKTYEINLGKPVVVGNFSKYPEGDVIDAEVCIVKRKFEGSPTVVPTLIEVFKKMKSLKVFVLAMRTPVYDCIFKRNYNDMLVNDMKDFNINITQVNSHDYGSLHEERLTFVIGSKIGAIKIPEGKVKQPITVRDLFEGITDKTPNQLDYRKITDDDIKNLSEINRAPRKLHWDSVSNRAVYFGLQTILHPDGDRSLSVREYLRLIGVYPDTCGREFVIEGDDLLEKQAIVSGAVPMCVTTVLAKEIKKAFNSYYANSHINATEFISEK